MVEGSFTRARAILEKNLEVVREGARALLREETVSGEDLGKLASKVPVWKDQGHVP